MVEAAGVEPASERPVAVELYMLIRPWYFAAGNKERRMRRPLAQMSLVPTTPGASQDQPTEWRSFPARRLTETNVTTY